MLTPPPNTGFSTGSGPSFDFSKFPNLQEVNVGVSVGWMHGGLPWIPTALSTIGPTTSPRLSSLRLTFAGSPSPRSIESLIEHLGDDLLRIAGEVTRIEREFEGVLNITVVRDLQFGAALGRLNVRFRFVGVGRDLVVTLIHFPSYPADPPETTTTELEII